MHEASLPALAMWQGDCTISESLWSCEIYYAGMIKARVCVERMHLYTGVLKDVVEVLGHVICCLHR